MTRILLFVATAISLAGMAAAADAQSRQRQAAPSMLPPPGYVPAPARNPRGPPWAMPNECYIDEGFGRFSPCR